LLLFFVFMLFIISSSDPSNSKSLSGSLTSSGQESIVDSELEELVEKINESEDLVSNEVKFEDETIEKEGLKSRFMSLFQRKGEVSTISNIESSGAEDMKIKEDKKEDASEKLEDKKIEETKEKEELLEDDTDEKQGIISRIFSKKDSEDNDVVEKVSEKESEINETMEEDKSLEPKKVEKNNGSSKDHIAVATPGVKASSSNHIAKGNSNMNSEAHSRARKYAPEVL